MRIQEVMTLALQLQPVERFELVDQILHSLDQPDPNVDKIWLAEAEKRLESYRTGTIQGIAAQEIFGDF